MIAVGDAGAAAIDGDPRPDESEIGDAVGKGVGGCPGVEGPAANEMSASYRNIAVRGCIEKGRIGGRPGRGPVCGCAVVAAGGRWCATDPGGVLRRRGRDGYQSCAECDPDQMSSTPHAGSTAFCRATSTSIHSQSPKPVNRTGHSQPERPKGPPPSRLEITGFQPPFNGRARKNLRGSQMFCECS